MYRDIPDDLRAMIEPVVEDHGCELVDVEVQKGPTTGLIRVTIDSPANDGRVPVDRCAEVSRELGVQLDAADAMPGAYRLEVSSPGLDRLLAREKDFQAACGSRVKVKTRRPHGGRRRFHGLLIAFEGGIARIEVDGTEYEVPFDQVEKANTIYQFSRDDFDARAAD